MDNWQGKRVVVTGAEGFIGSHLVEALAEHGAIVRAFIHYSPFGRREWLEQSGDQVEVMVGDVRDAGRVASALEGQDVVFHLASLIGIPYSYDAPDSYVMTNVIGTLNVLNASRRLDIARVVHTSTSEVYGSAIYVPIDEQHPLQTQSPYAATKASADLLAISYQRSFGVPVAIVRPFNTYGPRQSARAVIPTILSQLLAGKDVLRIGTPYPTRDFNYVGDTVRGFIAVAESDQALGNVVNIGSGREIAIGDLVEVLMEITGKKAEVVHDDQRVRPPQSEVERLLCDNTRAREWTGWVPEVGLEEGLRLTAEWFEKNHTLYRSDVYHV